MILSTQPPAADSVQEDIERESRSQEEVVAVAPCRRLLFWQLINLPVDVAFELTQGVEEI